MTRSEVKGLWFVVARRYLVDRVNPDLPFQMAELVAPELRPAILEPALSSWYPEACLQEFMRTFDQLVTRGDRKRLIAAFEECTLNGVHRFFQALLRLTSPDFLLRKTPVLWNYVRRYQGSVSVETNEERAIVRYIDFPYFEDVRYRLLALGTLRPLATLCGGTNPPGRRNVGFGRDWLDGLGGVAVSAVACEPPLARPTGRAEAGGAHGSGPHPFFRFSSAKSQFTRCLRNVSMYFGRAFRKSM